MSRKLKDSLAVANVNVYESTTTGKLDINGVHGRLQGDTLQEENCSLSTVC